MPPTPRTRFPRRSRNSVGRASIDHSQASRMSMQISYENDLHHTSTEYAEAPVTESSYQSTASDSERQPQGPLDSSLSTSFDDHNTHDSNILSPFNGFKDTAAVQHVRSLDQLESSTAQLFGTSAESDPWLLRHCKYDENGIRSFHRIDFRNAGGVPVEGLVPVHFLLTEDSLLKPAKDATAFCPRKGSEERQQELDALIPPGYGWRLIIL